MKRRRKSPLATAKAKADKAWAFRVKDRAGWKCEMCLATPAVLHAHHFVSRYNGRLRYSLRNGVALCAKDHLWGSESAHKGGPYFVAWFQQHRPEDYAYLMQARHRKPLSQNRTLADYQELIEALAPESAGMSDEEAA